MLRRLLVLLLCALGLPVALTLPVGADTFTVTSTTDGGAGSLRQAILDANATPGADTIVLGTDETYLLTDAAGELVSNAGPLTIEGNGSTIEQTVAGERVLLKGDLTALTVRDVTITGGDTPSDGGAISTDDDLTVEGSLIVGNRAGTDGGGLSVNGLVTVVDSTVAGNEAGGRGGGIGSTDASLTNSTVSGNDAAFVGGVLAVNQLALEYTTIVDNEAPVDTNLATSSLTSFASVVALPAGPNNCFIDSPTTSGGFNFSDDDSCGFSAATDAENAGDPQLTPLGFSPNDPIGDTPVHLPDGGSPLINRIPASQSGCDGDDQRGVSRPQGDGCDTGAVEVRPIDATPGTFSTPVGVPITIDLFPLVDDPDNQWFGGTTEVEWPSNIGDVALGENADEVTYTPASGFEGQAVITYEACSANATFCSTNTLTITVGSPTPTVAAPIPTTPVALPVSTAPAFTG